MAAFRWEDLLLDDSIWPLDEHSTVTDVRELWGREGTFHRNRSLTQLLFQFNGGFWAFWWPTGNAMVLGKATLDLIEIHHGDVGGADDGLPDDPWIRDVSALRLVEGQLLDSADFALWREQDEPDDRMFEGKRRVTTQVFTMDQEVWKILLSFQSIHYLA